MKLVEQHIIEKGDPRWAKLSEAAFASKNLWNAANYLVRQSFIFQGTYLDNVKVFHLIKFHEAYQALPRKISNQVLIPNPVNQCSFVCQRVSFSSWLNV